jgi:hypothetical protein
MIPDAAQQRAAEKILEDESLIASLKDDEAKPLIEWALQELETTQVSIATADALDAKVAMIRAAMKEINDLVGNKMDLVADDLEERMAQLLVGDLDPKSQTRLALEREIAQVTAAKDHLDNPELVRRLTQVFSKSWQQKSQMGALTVTTKATINSSTATAASAEEKKGGFLSRLFGKK